MCGAFGLAYDYDKLKNRYTDYTKYFVDADVKERYNIRPTTSSIVISNQDQPKIEQQNFGVVPFWSKDGKQILINAQAETVAEKATFKKMFKENRVLIP